MTRMLINAGIDYFVYLINYFGPIKTSVSYFVNVFVNVTCVAEVFMKKLINTISCAQ